MNKIIRLALGNIRKHKKESFLLGLLVTLGMILLAAAVSSLSGIEKITPKMVEESGCYQNFVRIDQSVYTDHFLTFFEDNPDVKRYDHISMADKDGKILTLEGGEKVSDISFVSVRNEERMETFQMEESLPEEQINALEHPIYLDSSEKDVKKLKLGDEITFLYGKKEYTYTVVGFYQSGLWVMGSKAVVSDEDFALLEEYCNRYEVIGFDTVDGSDNKALLKEFREFAKEISINDVTKSVFTSSYEEIVSSNTVNMSILSVVVAIMAGVVVVAVLFMIRFRIVNDIKEQIVSIGVLEAIGYRSGEIALSYIIEYLLIALISAAVAFFPAYAMAGGLLQIAAQSIHYGGTVPTGIDAIIVTMTMILLFIILLTMTKALSVNKYPPVLAFRKGIGTHNFKKSWFPLEKTKGNVHIRLALGEFMHNCRANIGLTICIMVSTIMVLVSFLLGNFLGNPDEILTNVCGHEMCDVRIESIGAIDQETFAEEIRLMPEVDKVLCATASSAVTFVESEQTLLLEVYQDYADTKGIVVTQGRLPEHDNEIAITSQGESMLKVHLGDTVSIEYGKVTRDYMVCGIVNSVVNASTCYMTESGFKRVNPAYTPDVIDIYLKDGVDPKAFAQGLTDRYGNEIVDISNAQVTGDTYEERIRSEAQIQMAKAMIENGVSYMEYAIRVGDEMITGSTNTMRIRSVTFQKEFYQEIISSLTMTFLGISIMFMIVAAIVVMIILSILMSSTIKNQYRELGILKSLGYTSKELKFQLAFRIVPAAIVAVLLGSVFSILILGLLENVLAKITISYGLLIITDLGILIFSFVSAYFCAGKIKKISVRELMTE